jgi:hypothetical protein
MFIIDAIKLIKLLKLIQMHTWKLVILGLEVRQKRLQ